MNSFYLAWGTIGVRIDFPCTHFAALACKHIFLSKDFDGRTVGAIEYIECDPSSLLMNVPCNPNAICIDREDFTDTQWRISLRMFDKYTVQLDVEKDKVCVRYPSDAPIRLMLDDVLQAALQPILDTLGGFILHGSCMVNDGVAIVFMGNSGSGKSTTAFNLMRFGFLCYADDAVIVTPSNDALCVWPLTREISIRPLSFRLFHDQGINMSEYKKDGDKYYFGQVTGEYLGAILKYICFVEVSGENETTISYIDPEKTLEILLSESRHFSFMGRQSAKTYSRILTQKVPMALIAGVGMDLDAQGRTFENVVLGYEPTSKEKSHSQMFLTERNIKVGLIRKAWSASGREPLEKLIPLLGDFDPKVFSLALSFFQTHIPAHLEVLESPLLNGPVPGKFEASWLRAAHWAEGCRELLSRTGVEIAQQFSFAWIKSAPFLYPFLRVLSSHVPEKTFHVEDAWSRYKREQNISIFEDGHYGTGIHLLNFQGKSQWTNPVFDEWWKSLTSLDGNISHLYCWITEEGQPDWKRAETFLRTVGESAHIRVIPVGPGNRHTYACSMEFMRFALSNGFRLKISRLTPLCRIGREDSSFLFDAEAFELHQYDMPQKHIFYEKPGEDRIVMDSLRSIRDIRRSGLPIHWLERPYRECESCGLYCLCLCRGGFWSKVESSGKERSA